MIAVRRATEADIPAILRLLVQVNMVHHNGRPDLFKGPTTKYNEAELKAILAGDEQAGVCVLKMEETLDAGDYCLAASTEIGRKDAASLAAELADLGGQALVEALEHALATGPDAAAKHRNTDQHTLWDAPAFLDGFSFVRQHKKKAGGIY